MIGSSVVAASCPPAGSAVAIQTSSNPITISRIQSARLHRRDPRDNNGTRCDLRRDSRLGWLESGTVPAWLLGPVAVVALTLVAAGWLALRGVPATVVWLDIGSPGDDAYITGAFPPERNANESYRWTTPSAIVTVPAPSDAHYRLDIAIASVGDQPRTLRVTCPGAEATATLATGLTPASVTIVCRSDDGAIDVSLSVPETRAVGDGRPLGVALRDIRLSAIDAEEIAIWRLRTGLTAAAALIGAWLALAALTRRPIATAVAFGLAALALAISVRHPDWTLAASAGPAGLIALAGGYASWLLAAGRRAAPTILGLLSVISWLLIHPPEPTLLLPALWTPNDAIGYRLLTWLAALTIVAAAFLAGRRSASLAAIATLVATGSLLVPIAARPLLESWSLVIAGPDWTDTAAPVGALLFLATASVGLLAFRSLSGSTIPPRLALVAVVALALAVLIPWRNAVMDLNGDEPHYYVTAHSLAVDRDLELLDDYLDPDYLSDTISPTGNIAVERATNPDLYAAFVPALADAWHLVPDASAGLTTAAKPGLTSAIANPLIVSDRDDNQDALPPLSPSTGLLIPISGPCEIESLSIATADGLPVNATVRLLDAAGAQLWHSAVNIDDGVSSLYLPLDATTCVDDFAGAITIAADRDIVAQAIDSGLGLHILAASPASPVWLLGPLPRDHYATQDATARLALHNPGATPATATIRLLTAAETTLRATSLELPPGATAILDLDLHNGAAVLINAAAPIAATGVGWQPGGSFALQRMTDADNWQAEVPAASDVDSGVWLALANRSTEQRAVAINDGGEVETASVCGFCAEMVYLPTAERSRTVSMTSVDGPIAFAAVVYTERTGSLHFDMGLPLLAALPVWFAGSDGAPVVSALATVWLAAGLYELLRRVGVTEQNAARGAGAVALLAPLSPYAVRLYTEPLAACLVVWSLVCWDRARVHPGFAAAALALAGLLPVVHGRYAPLALVLGALAVAAVARRANASRRQLLMFVAVTITLVTVVAFSPLAVALRDRLTGSYFSTEWVPRNLLGVLLDRGSGLLPFAPWCLLTLAVGRRISPLQRVGLVLFVIQLSVVVLRAGGWQTFGAPGRYLLPVVPLLGLLAVPGALHLWPHSLGRLAVTASLGWSVAATLLLHWLPLSGYVSEGRYFIDDARRELPMLAPFDAFPAIAPVATSNPLGIALLLTLWSAAWMIVQRSRTSDQQATVAPDSD